MAGENIEDELRSVKHAARKRGLKIAELRWTQIVIEEDQVGVGGGSDPGNLFNFSAPINVAGSGARGAASVPPQFRRRRSDQFAKFSQRLICIQPRRNAVGLI